MRLLVYYINKNILNVSRETFLGGVLSMKRKTRIKIERQLKEYPGNNEEWNEIIKNRINCLNEEEYKLIELRFFKRKTINYITYELYMSRNKCFSMIDNILTEIALDAAYHQLIKR